jgi:hypothetical protein
MTCIYCLKDSTDSKSFEHVIPANLGCTDVLPRGYVCDHCNNYFSKIDNVILHNNHISLTVGAEQILNREGKFRKSIGPFRFMPQKGHVQINLGPVKITSETREISFTMQQPKEFDESLFARGLHKVAFNCFTQRFGKSEALRDCFNKVRNYARNAKKDEFWPYIVQPINFNGVFLALFNKYKDGWFVDFNLPGFQFLVSLEGQHRAFESMSNETCFVIRETGQWNESSLLGLCHKA